MNKENTVLVWSFGLFLLMNVFVSLGYGWQLPAMMLWIAGGWVIVSVILFFVIKHQGVNIIYVLVNAGMTALTIAAYYVKSAMPLYRLGDMLWWGLGVFIIQAIVMNLVGKTYKANTALAIASVAGMIYGIYQLLRGFVVWGSALIFLFVFMLCLNIALRYYRKRGMQADIIEILKLTSMLIFGGVLVAVISLITEGDALEFFAYMGDAGIDTQGARKKM